MESVDNAVPSDPILMKILHENPRDNIWDLVPFLYIPATRINLPGRHVFDGTIEDQDNVRISGDPLKYLFDTESGIFNGRHLELAIDWLRRENVGEIARNRNSSGKLWHLVTSCAKSICNEVVHDDAHIHYVELKDYSEFSLSERDRASQHGDSD